MSASELPRWDPCYESFWERHMVSLTFGGLAILSALLIMACIASERQWAKYAAENHCRMISRVAGQVIFNTGKAGDFIVPERTTYACDGGVTITR